MTTTYLTVPEAAEYLNTSVRFVRRLVAERRIAFHKVGSHVRIARSDLDAFLKARTSGADHGHCRPPQPAWGGLRWRTDLATGGSATCDDASPVVGRRAIPDLMDGSAHRRKRSRPSETPNSGSRSRRRE